MFSQTFKLLVIFVAFLLTTGCANQRSPIKYAGRSNARTAYETHGRGEKAIVFIHGWTCNRSFWSRQVPALQNDYRVILVDLPGHGQSDAPQIDYTIPYFADSVKAVLDDAGVKRAVLVGHSLGFSISREVARKYPDRVVALISADGSPLHPPVSNSPADVEAWRQRINGFIDRVTRPDPKTARVAFVESMFREDTSAELRMEILTKMALTPDHVAVSAISGLADPNLWHAEPMNLPVLAILARYETTPSDRAEQWHRMFPQVEYHEWTDCGHFPMMEKPEEFNAVVGAFLKGQTW